MNRDDRGVHATFSDRDAMLERLREAMDRANEAEPVATIGRELVSGPADTSLTPVPAEAGEEVSGPFLAGLRRQVTGAPDDSPCCEDCGTQVGAAMKVLAPVLARAEAAEAKMAGIEEHAPAITDALRHALAYVEHVPDPSSQAAAGRYRTALAVIGTDDEAPDAYPPGSVVRVIEPSRSVVRRIETTDREPA